MANSTKLGLEITGDNAGAIKALKGVESELGKVDAKTKQTNKSQDELKKMLKGVALGAGLKVAIGEYEDAEKVARQTEAAIKSTGNAAQISAKQQNDMADSLSKIAAVDDEVISGGANLLRTFTSIKGEAFEPTLQAALDLSAVLGTDLNSNVQLLGKALNDPEKGLARLTRAGVVFTDQQKEQIKTLQQSGDKLGAQKVILAEVEKEFGGQAAAAATSSDRMKVALGNAAEAAGGVLAPAFEKAATATVGLAGGFEHLPKPMQQTVLIGTAAALLGPRLKESFDKVKGGLVGAEGGATKFGTALGALAVVGAALSIKQMADEANKFTFSAEKAAQATDEELLANLMKLATIDPGILKNLDLETLYRLRDIAKETGKEVPGLGDAIKEVQGKEERASAAHAKYGAEVDGVKNSAAGAVGPVEELGTAFAGLNVGTDKAVGSMKNATDAIGKAADGAKDLFDAQVAVDQSAESVASAEQGVEAAHKGVASASRSLSEAHRGVADAARGVQDAQQGLADASNELAAAQRDASQGTRELRDANDGVTDAEHALAQAQRDSKQAQLDLTAARADAAEQLDDLGRSAEGAVLSEKEAVLGLAEAKQRLADLGKPGADGKATEVTPQERARAALAVERAELGIRDAVDSREEAQARLADAEKKGIEGSDAVTAAKGRIVDAAGKEKDAEQAVADAKERVTQVQEALADRVVQAQDKVTEASQRVVDAQGAVKDAQQRVVDATAGLVDARGQVTEAEKAVTDALLAQIATRQVLDVMQLGSKEATKAQIDRYRELAATLDPASPLRQHLLQLADALNGVSGIYNITLAINALGSDIADGIGSVTRKLARGGDVAPGESVIVGDGGRPEVFTAGPTGGHVFPDASKFSGGITSNINVYGTVDPATVAEMVAARQGRDLRRMALV